MKYTEEEKEIVFLNDQNIVHTLYGDSRTGYNALPSLSLVQSCFVELCSHSDALCSDLCNAVTSLVETSCSNLSSMLTAYADNLSTILSNKVCEHLSTTLTAYTDQTSVKLSNEIMTHVNTISSVLSSKVCEHLSGSLSDYTDSMSVKLSVNVCKQLSAALSGYSDSLCSQLCSEIEDHYLKNDNDVLSGTLSILNGVAIGKNAVISVGADNSIAIGHNARVDHHNSFVWNGSNEENYIYKSKGDHTFNINPAAGLCGIYVGEKTLCSLISIDTALSIQNVKNEASTKYALTNNTYTKNDVNEISRSLSNAVTTNYALCDDVYSKNEIDVISATLSNTVSSQYYVKKDDVKFEYNYTDHALNLSIQDGTVLSVSTNQFEVGRFVKSVCLSNDDSSKNLSIDIEFVLDSTKQSTQHILIPIKDLTQIYTAGNGIKFEQLSNATYNVSIADDVATSAYCDRNFTSKSEYACTSADVVDLQKYAAQLSTKATGTIDVLSSNISALLLADVRKLKFTHIMSIAHSDLTADHNNSLSDLLLLKKAVTDNKIQNGAIILVKFDDSNPSFGLSYTTTDGVVLGNNDFIIIRDVNTSTTELSLSDLSPTGSTQNVFITNAVHRYEYENLSANLSNAVVSANTKIDRKVYVDGVSAESLCAMHIDADEFHQLVLDDKLLSNMIYVVSSDNINAYDMRIMNVVDPVDAQDAATKNYVDTYINSLDVEELTASAAQTVKSISETDGKISIVLQDIAIEQSAVNQLTADRDCLSSAIDSKISVGNYDGSKYNFTQSDLSVVTINTDTYHQMVTDGETDDHVVYIMSSDYINAYDNFIKNVKTPENDTDAANKKYVDDISATISSTLETTVNTVSMDISAAFEAADEALDTKLSNKITVDGICVDTLPIEHINNEDFYKLVADDKVQASVMYIVSGDYVNAYDMNIKNVHDPVADQDAATKTYVDKHGALSLKAAIQNDPVLSTYANDPAKTIDINSTELSTMLSAAMALFNAAMQN